MLAISNKSICKYSDLTITPGAVWVPGINLANPVSHIFKAAPLGIIRKMPSNTNKTP